MHEFKDEVVWVTGASSGIGRAASRQLLESGADVILTARSEGPLQELADGRSGAKVVTADLTDEDDRRAAVEAATSWKGRIDVLINNAGISQRSRALETDAHTTREIMELNFFAPVALARAVCPGMVERDHGRVAVVSSMAAYLPTPGRSSYGASKAAINTWHESLRAELADTDVSVTLATPGYVSTGISKRARTSDGSQLDKVAETDEQGISPDTCARQILRAIASGKREVSPGGWETWAIYIKRFLPGLAAKLLPRFAAETE